MNLIMPNSDKGREIITFLTEKLGLPPVRGSLRITCNMDEPIRVQYDGYAMDTVE
jgi:hypothetical protein